MPILKVTDKVTVERLNSLFPNGTCVTICFDTRRCIAIVDHFFYAKYNIETYVTEGIKLAYTYGINAIDEFKYSNGSEMPEKFYGASGNIVRESTDAEKQILQKHYDKNVVSLFKTDPFNKYQYEHVR